MQKMLPPRERYSRWLTRGSVALISVIVLATAWIVATTRTRAVGDAAREIRSFSLVLAEQLDRSFQSIEILEQSVIAEVARSATAPDQFRQRFSDKATFTMLKQKISALPHISVLALRDRDGQIVSSTAEWPARAGLLEPNPASVMQEQKLASFVSAPTKSPLTGKWAVYVAKPITAHSGEFMGLVLGSMRLDSLEEMFKGVAPNKASSIALFREDGTLMARYPSHESALGVTFSAQALGAGALSAEFQELRMKSPIDGVERLIASRRLPHFPMSVTMTASLDEALAEWRAGSVYLLAASTSVILAIVVIVLLARRQFLSELATRNAQFSGALNNITQGLIVFDRQGQVVLCNRRYSEMYGLPPGLAVPGRSLCEILRFRKANGTFEGDPETYTRRLMARESNELEARDAQTGDGRFISVLSANLPDGGWLSTHEDITERVKREESFRLLFESNPVPMWVFDHKTLEFIAVNEAAINTYGYSREEFLSLSILDVRPPEVRQVFRAWLGNIPRVNRDDRLWQHVTADGRLMDVSIYSQALEYDGRDARLVAVHDVTEQKRGAEQLAKNKRFLDAVIENVPLPIIVKDVPSGSLSAERCRFSLINRAAEELFGFSREHCIGQTLVDTFGDSAGPVARDQMCLDSGSGSVREDESAVQFTKGVRLIRSKRIVIPDQAGRPEHLVSLLDDITDKREAEQRIAYMAHHDVLTGLANRASFDQRFAVTLEAAKDAESYVSVLCIDLDGFKEVNDTYGHSTGDAVLKEVARRLVVCGGDAFIARFGGDEFTMIVADDDTCSLSRRMAGQLLSAMEMEIQVGDKKLCAKLTIGVAQFPAHGTDCETLLGNADLALYRAKAADPGTVKVFSAALGSEVRERRTLQDDLRRAIAEDQLFLHYQPQVIADGTTIGFEALARWDCPKRGPVSPATFIEVAEESNLILALGESVLRSACSEAASWTTQHKVAVNISPKQFRHGDLPALVHSVLMETGLPPNRLELEITEGVLIGDFSRALSILNRLKALGVEIALDDFGTGYSSLSYLHSFPFDLIKIDRGFIKDVESNRHSRAIVKAVLGLGRSLGVPVLAEGVETKGVFDFLFEEGCFAVQGYYCGKPMRAEVYASTLYQAEPAPRRLLGD